MQTIELTVKVRDSKEAVKQKINRTRLQTSNRRIWVRYIFFK